MARKKPTSEGKGATAPDPQKLLENPRRIRSDLRLLRRAAQWTKLSDLAEKTQDRVNELLDSPSERIKLGAARAVVAMMGQQQADDHLEEKCRRLDEGKAIPDATTSSITVRVPGINTAGASDEHSDETTA